MSFVYKYFPPDRLGFLDDGLIRFTPPGALNDPYECLPALPEDLERMALERLRKSIADDFRPSALDDRNTRRVKAGQLKAAMERLDKKLKKEPGFFREEFFRHTNGNLDSNLGILSLSRRWNSGLMWSHYTSSYAGFCVGLNKEHTFFEGIPDKSGERFPLSSVRYSEHRTVVTEQRLGHVAALNILLTKSMDWLYEEEERLVSFLSSAHVKKDFAPFNIHLFKVPFDAIGEIIVGHRASAVDREKVVSAAKQLGVPAYQTKISDSSFDVEKKLLRSR